MKLPASQIELAASQESSRFTIQSVKIDVQGKRAMATDGHILAIVPCEVHADDHSALISIDTIKNLRAIQKRAKSVPISIRTNSKVTVIAPSESAEYETVTGTFPNVDAVIPKDDVSLTVRLDVEMLMRLAKAMSEKGADGRRIVRLYIRDPQSSVLVKMTENPDAIGVIMPCRDK